MRNRFQALRFKKAVSAGLDKKELTLDIQIWQVSAQNAIKDYAASPSEVMLQKVVTALDRYEKAFAKFTAAGLVLERSASDTSPSQAFFHCPSAANRAALLVVLGSGGPSPVAAPHAPILPSMSF